MQGKIQTEIASAQQSIEALIKQSKNASLKENWSWHKQLERISEGQGPQNLHLANES